jgi:division/cell wall cluster transcriptional repressor MraZ
MLEGIAENGADLLPILGGEDLTVDSKGRILVGKKLRDALGDTFALAQYSSHSLMAFPHKVWTQVIREVRSAPLLNPGRATIQRLFLGMSEDDVTFDRQGRFVIPNRLRTAVNFDDKTPLTLIGADCWVEIWDRAAWRDLNNDPDAYLVKDRRMASLDENWKRMRTGGAA